MLWDPQEYIAYELVLTSPTVPGMSGSSNLDSFRDGWLVSGCTPAIKILKGLETSGKPKHRE